MTKYENIIKNYPPFEWDTKSFLKALMENRIFGQRVGETPKQNKVVIFELYVDENNQLCKRNLNVFFETLGYKLDKYYNIICPSYYNILIEVLEILREAEVISPKEYKELWYKVYKS
jgi:hypothetical protein